MLNESQVWISEDDDDYDDGDGCDKDVQVKDVRVPEQLMRAMAAEAEAARDARAKVFINNWRFANFVNKVIAAEGEHKASRALRMAAEVIMDSPAALQVPSHLLLSPHLFLLSCAICKPWTALRQKTTARSSSQSRLILWRISWGEKTQNTSSCHLLRLIRFHGLLSDVFTTSFSVVGNKHSASRWSRAGRKALEADAWKAHFNPCLI